MSTASISGHVFIPSDTAAVGSSVRVSLYSAQQTRLTYVSVQVDGTYRLDGLAAGTYRLLFDASAESGLVDEWFADAADFASSSPVRLAAGEARTDVDAQLAGGGGFAGTVSVPADGSSSEGPDAVQVRAKSTVPGSSLTFVTRVLSDGTYLLTGLPAGEYRVAFDASAASGLVDEYYDDTTVPSDAIPVTVTAGKTKRGVNAALAAGGSIEGRVTLPPGVTFDSTAYRVIAYDENRSSAGATPLSADGTYALRGLEPGEYRLSIETPASSGALPEWFNDAQEYASASPITVGAGQTVSNRDMRLALGARISGSVVDASGTPQPGVRVSLYERTGSTWTFKKTVTTDAGGTYGVTRLLPSVYTLQFSPPRDSNLRPGWWQNAASQSEATKLTLSEGQERSGLVATLTSGATVSGAVRSSAGDPVVGAKVQVFSRVGAELGSSVTDARGLYAVPGLAGGDVAVGVLSDAGLVYSNGATSPVTAAFTSLESGAVTVVDISLAGRTVSGYISAADTRARITAGTVTLISSTGAVGRKIAISRSGTYVLRNVPSGDYVLRVDPVDSAYNTTWTGGAGSAAEADSFTVSTASAKVNVSVGRSASITGVSKPAGESGLTIVLWRHNGVKWSRVEQRWVASGSPFTFSSVAPGLYTVLFDSVNGPSPRPVDAEAVTVGAGGAVDVGPVTNAPAGAGSLAGLVTGAVDATATVHVSDGAGRTYVSSVLRQPGGSYMYDFPALPRGVYTLFVTSENAPTTWYGGTGVDSARGVSIGSGTAVRANISLAAGTGALSGYVVDSNGTPVPNAVVTVSDVGYEHGTVGVKTARTGADGRYRFEAVLALHASYWVEAVESGSLTTGPIRLVTVNSPQPTLDLALSLTASRIYGAVEDAVTGQRISGATVRLDGRGRPDQVTTTDDTGRYEFPGLSAGDYFVQVGTYDAPGTQPGSAYAPLWLKNGPFRVEAAIVRVGSRESLAAPTAKLGLGGVLTGRVRGMLAESSGPVALEEASVSVEYVTNRGNTVVATGDVTQGGDAPGTFSLVLPPGTYRVCVSVPADGAYSTVFPATCESVTVAARQVNAHIDMVLTGLLRMESSKPVIRGKVEAGSVLTADPGSWSPGATITYQWYRDTLPIARATNRTLTLGANDRGGHITVAVKGAKEGYASQTETSVPTATVR